MTKIVPYEPWHLKAIKPQDEQLFVQMMLTDEYAVKINEIGPAFSAVNENEVLGSAGFWDAGDYAQAWAVLGCTSGKSFVTIHRAVTRVFAVAKWGRIETFVRQGFTQGERWAKALGFKLIEPDAFKGEIDGKTYGKWVRRG